MSYTAAPDRHWDTNSLIAKLRVKLSGVESLRQDALAARKKGIPVVIALALLCAVVGVLNYQYIIAPRKGDLSFYHLIPIIFALGVLMWVADDYFGSPARRYKRQYKSQVICTLVGIVQPGMSYHPKWGLPIETVRASGLCKKRPSESGSKNLFEGMMGKTSLRFAEVHAEKASRLGDRREAKTVFRGILAEADFHKQFKSEVFVTPDFAEAKFGRLSRSFQGLSGNLQLMENPEFEKAFVVRCADPVEARYILTPAMQMRLLALRGRFKDDVRISFRNSKVFIALPHEKNWMEPQLKLSADDERQFADFLSQMQACFGVVDELNLNTRIWTKE